jgi:thymidylate synthase
MSLAQFNIIVTTDSNDGISKGGCIPWTNRADAQFFREKTIGTGNNTNVVIMGRNTYETLERPLEGRLNVVVSTSLQQIHNPGVSIYASLKDALQHIGSSLTVYKEVYIIGGGKLYSEAVNQYMYLCKKIWITRLKTNYQCDISFPYSSIKNFDYGEAPNSTRDYTRYLYVPNLSHEETKYLDLIRLIKDTGEVKKDSSGVNTKVLFGESLSFDISERIPLISTKEMNHKNLITELIFFMSGSTNTKLLEAQGVATYKKVTSLENDKMKELKYLIGDIGPYTGFQLRHWGSLYDGMEKSYEGCGIDQLSKVIESIKENPFGVDHIILLTDINTEGQCMINSDVCYVQFNVSADNRRLDCCVNIKSVDMFLELPKLIFLYSVLTHMICHVCNLKPQMMFMHIGCAKLYFNHSDAISRQLQRTPLPLCNVRFRNFERILAISDFNVDNVEICGYTSWPVLNIK